MGRLQKARPPLAMVAVMDCREKKSSSLQSITGYLYSRPMNLGLIVS